MSNGYKPGEQKVVANIERMVNWAQKPKIPKPKAKIIYDAAPWWRRVAAVGIDFFYYTCVAFVGFILFFVPLGASLGQETQATRIVMLLAAIVFLILPVTALSALRLASKKPEKNGQTWGKKIMHLRVVRDDGKPWTLASALWRQLVLKIILPVVCAVAVVLLGSLFNTLGLVQAETIGIVFISLAVILLLVFALWPIFDERGRGLHDRIAKSSVRYQPQDK
jgi:uncharacterized RDD family membrane protein YckC